MGITHENLNQALCYFKIEAREKSYTRVVQEDKAKKGLEALTKVTYSAMFDFIIFDADFGTAIAVVLFSLSHFSILTRRLCHFSLP